MATYSTLKTAVKEHCSISDSNTTYDTPIARWLNDAQSDFASESNWKYLEKRGSITSSTFQFKYTLADDNDVVTAVLWEHDHYLTPVNHDRWIRLNLHDSSGTPRYYIVQEGSLCLHPKPDNSGNQNSLYVGISSNCTDSLFLTNSANFEEKGRIIVDSEVIEFAESSGNTLKMLRRGMEGTTPAAHSAGADATHRNIEYDYYKVLADMSGDNDVSDIPSQYHRALPLYAAAQFFYKTEDRTQGDKYMNQYLVIREQAKRDLGEKQAQMFSTTLDDTPSRYKYRDNLQPDDSSLEYL